jgi:uncharacterized tellurite resistance protein B-like protein
MGDDDGAVLRVLLGVWAADEVDAEEGVEAVCTAYRTLTGRQITVAEAAAAREAVTQPPGAWLDAARSLAAQLDRDKRMALFSGAFDVATADGFVLEEEDRVLATLAAALGMTEHDYRDALDRLIAATR